MNRASVMIAAAVAVGAVSSVLAHSFYDPWCCRGEVDCQPIPSEAVQISPRGYVVTLRPTDHTMLVNEPGPRTYVVPFREAKPSPDRGYHACIYPSPETLRCFYAPPFGS